MLNLPKLTLYLVFSVMLGVASGAASPQANVLGNFQPGNNEGLAQGPSAHSIANYEMVKTWGGTSSSTQASNIVVDDWGNRYIAGEFTGTVAFDPAGGVSKDTHGAQDAFLSKFDAAGSFIWVKTWGGIDRDVAIGLALDNIGNIYVSGSFQNTVDFNPEGGESHSSNAGSMNNIYLSKFTPEEGAFQWVKTWGPSDGGAESYSLAVDGTDHIYVVGDFTGTSCDFNPWNQPHDVHANHPPAPGSPYGWLFDAYLSKFDTAGNFVWAKTWGGEGYDDGPGVAVDGSNNIYVGGMYASTDPNFNFDPDGGPGGLGHPAHDSGIVVDAFFSKFASDGTFQWVRTWGGQGTDEVGQTIAVDQTNNIYLTGRFGCTSCDFNPGGTEDLHSSHGDLDAFISQYAANGDFHWARTWGGTGWDSVGSAVTDDANHIFIAGFFKNTVDFGSGSGVPSHGGWDVFLSEFNASGNFQGAQTWGGSGDDMGLRVAWDPAGEILATGTFQGLVDFDPDIAADNHTALGTKDAFLSTFNQLTLDKFFYLPLVRK